jgi:predicted TIM-barrel fold metal-dependent hydrolase
MKKSHITLTLVQISFLIQAQVRIYPPAKEGYEQRIRNHIDSMRVVDTHEHLMNPAGIAKSPMCDFTLLLHHYADDDIKSAGMPKAVFDGMLSDTSLTVMQKWNLIKPWWEKSKNTAYNRVVLLTIKELFGIDKLDETTVEPLSAKIKEVYKTDWFNYVIESKCKADFVIVDGNDRSYGDPAKFRYVQRFGYYGFSSKKDFENLAKQYGIKIQSVDDLTASLEKDFQKAVEKGFVAVKNGTAYSRSQFYEDVDKETAQKTFVKIQNSENPLPFDSVKPLSDYMWHRTIELARKYNKPIQIHTGLQAGDGNYIENSNPALLANLFLKYRDVKFILFHGGYPYGGELSSLAKNFQNVYIDLCWLYIISPSYSERYLHEWLETVPANKIMAFGGDYHNIENVYGHLLFAKEIVANVLIEKVKDGYFSEEEAIKFANMMLHDNAVNLFKLAKE